MGTCGAMPGLEASDAAGGVDNLPNAGLAAAAEMALPHNGQKRALSGIPPPHPVHFSIAASNPLFTTYKQLMFPLSLSAGIRMIVLWVMYYHSPRSEPSGTGTFPCYMVQ